MKAKLRQGKGNHRCHKKIYVQGWNAQSRGRSVSLNMGVRPNRDHSWWQLVQPAQIEKQQESKIYDVKDEGYYEVMPYSLHSVAGIVSSYPKPSLWTLCV